MAKVSVIVPTYNRKNFLPHTLQTLYNQIRPDIEIVVVNDAGEDVSDIIDACPKVDGITLKYVNKEKNGGLGAARNTGIESSTGEWIMFLDDDDGFFPHHVETLMSSYEQVKNPFLYTDAIRLLQQRIRINETTEAYVTTGKDIPWSLDCDDSDMLLVHNISPVTCFAMKRAFIGDERFDETLSVYEDWDMWIRLSQKRVPQHIAIPTCFFTWRDDGSTMSSSRLGFSTLLPQIFEKYRGFAKNRELVIERQNEILNQRGLPIYIEE